MLLSAWSEPYQNSLFVEGPNCEHYYNSIEYFFISALADGFSLVFKWQQISSNLQESSYYSCQLQQCWSLAVHLLPSYSMSSSLGINSLVTVAMCPIWCYRHVHVSQFCQFLSKCQVHILIFPFFQIFSVKSRDSNVHNTARSLLFSCWLFFGLVVWPSLGDPFVFQNSSGDCTSPTLGGNLVWSYTICSYAEIFLSSSH